MKKIFVSPEIKVFAVKAEQQFLAGSGVNAASAGIEYGGTTTTSGGEDEITEVD